jgi:serine/threonine-protein kinase SRPK3
MTPTDSEIYAGLDDARVSKLLRIDGLPTDAHAPRGVTPSIHPKNFVPWGFLQEKIAVIGLGSSFKKETTPSALTAVDYRPPEMLLGALTTHIRGQAIDIWSLGCLIFEIRTGSCLFEQYFGGPDEVLRDIVLTLGKLPEPWWSSWAKRTQYFDESGAAKKPYQLRNIRSALEEVGNHRQSWFDLFEKPGMQIPQKEIEPLDDLLKKMLRYTPEQRITIDDVIRHPWFALK